MSERNFSSCPFCGRNSVVALESADLLYATCVNGKCQATGPACNTEDEAIQKWNDRANMIASSGVSADSVLQELKSSIHFLQGVIDKLEKMG